MHRTVLQIGKAVASSAAIVALSVSIPSFAGSYGGDPGGSSGPSGARNAYVAHNLVSDGFIPADQTDPHLVNGWGIAASGTGPWWVSDNATNGSSLYAGAGAVQSLFVQVPGTPTGIVNYGGTNFIVSDGVGDSGPSRFLFATEDGTIIGWNPGVPPPPLSTHGFVVVDSSGAGAIYKGLAYASTDAGDRLYATDFHNARVDVFDGSFAPVVVPGAFVDPRIPEGFAPFGIQNIGGRIFVAYAKQDADAEDEEAGHGLGFVSAFSDEGAFLGRIARRGRLNAPWGMALAPEGFGKFGGDLLVGNFGDGRIIAYKLSDDMARGLVHGVLRDPDHNPIEIDGLWGIGFGNGTSSGPTDTLYFAAGPGDETHGLFGKIEAAP